MVEAPLLERGTNPDQPSSTGVEARVLFRDDHLNVRLKADGSTPRPGVCDQPWGWTEMHLVDPFGNKLRFAERKQERA